MTQLEAAGHNLVADNTRLTVEVGSLGHKLLRQEQSAAAEAASATDRVTTLQTEFQKLQAAMGQAFAVMANRATPSAPVAPVVAPAKVVIPAVTAAPVQVPAVPACEIP